MLPFLSVHAVFVFRIQIARTCHPLRNVQGNGKNGFSCSLLKFDCMQICAAAAAI